MTVRDVARVAVAAFSLGACSWWSNLGAKSWPMSNVPAANGEVADVVKATKNKDASMRVVMLGAAGLGRTTMSL